MITMLYAALLALVYIGLTLCVVQGRFKHRIGLGDGGIEPMTQRIRAHANFAEYVPFALLLIFLVEYARYPAILVHALGTALVIARILHAVGLYGSPNKSLGRMYGTIATVSVMLVSALLLLWMFFVMNVTGF